MCVIVCVCVCVCDSVSVCVCVCDSVCVCVVLCVCVCVVCDSLCVVIRANTLLQFGGKLFASECALAGVSGEGGMRTTRAA